MHRRTIEEMLGNFVDDEQRESEHAGRIERQAARRLDSDVGDRQSDALARQMAMAPVLDKLLHPDLPVDSPSRSSSSQKTSQTNQALYDEIDRQLSSPDRTKRRTTEKTHDDWAWDSVFLDPGERRDLVLSSKTPVKNPKIKMDFGTPEPSKYFKLLSITQDGKTILASASINDLIKGVIFQGTASKDHPIKISVLNTGKYRLSFQGSYAPS